MIRTVVRSGPIARGLWLLRGRLALFRFRSRGAVAGTPILVRLLFPRGLVVARRLVAAIARLLVLPRLLALGIRGGFIRGRGARWTIAAVPRVIHCGSLPHAQRRMSRDEPQVTPADRPAVDGA